jgi:uroporphyrin-III C-methyltransferase
VTEADLDAAKSRRIRWLSQICEYWPLRRLASITDTDVEAVLNAYASNPSSTTPPLESSTLAHRSSSTDSARGRIILAGSGPGHPDLLTRATHKAILLADLILADKLVPSGVLDLIPRRTPVHIARKFPGNADAAQEELLFLGLAGLKAGKTVLRLKQGDPYIYGRGGEEYEFFRKEGYGGSITVLPGITSALSAPLFAAIPATQRAVSDQVLICTGTGRKGVPCVPPEYVPSRTVVFLMALHRIEGLVLDLTSHALEKAAGEGSEKDNELQVQGQGSELSSPREEDQCRTYTRTLHPPSTPCAVIERASCPDQRVIRTTLAHVAAAIEEEGSRPPGLLVVGRACEVLVIPDGLDGKGGNWKGGRKWIVEEGFKGLEWIGGLAGLDRVEMGNEGIS